MSYINVGVKINGRDAKSKKAIKEAMLNAPETVEFYGTSDFGPFHSMGDTLTQTITNSDKLSVVGPNPYNKRDFYGTVELTTKGLIKVS